MQVKTQLKPELKTTNSSVVVYILGVVNKDKKEYKQEKRE